MMIVIVIINQATQECMEKADTREATCRAEVHFVVGVVHTPLHTTHVLKKDQLGDYKYLIQ